MKLPLLSLLLFFSLLGNAQEFGGYPPSKKWQQVNSNAVRIIYPAGLDTTAMRIADIVTYLDGKTLNTIGPKQKKVSILLHNQTTISNAFVTLGPFHSEFYLTPMQNSFELGSVPWEELLAVHEYRHVQQYNNFNVGVSHLVRVLFGELGQALANGAAIPDWFFEGDAVYNETNVTSQGRGRLPYFHNDYRSLWQAGKQYSWMKLRNGSLKDFVPDHYALGYLMVAYGREKYGDEFWKKVTGDAAAFKSLVYPFQAAIKKYSGKSYVTFRDEALKYFKDLYKHEPMVVPPGSKEFYNKEYPSYSEDGHIIYIKSSYKQTPAFIIRNGKNERKLRAMDITPDHYYSYRNSTIVYASSRPDARWGNIVSNDIQHLDVSTGKQKTITSHNRYFSPDINSDGKIVAVDLEKNGKTFLHIIDAANGQVTMRVPNAENVFYTYPKFLSGGQIISPARNKKGEMFLALINTNDGSMEALTQPSFEVMGFPVIKNDTVYFTSAAGQTDQLFAYTLHDKKLYTLSSSKLGSGLGNYQPAVNDGNITWTTFTANGFRLLEEDKKTLSWTEVLKAKSQKAPPTQATQEMMDFGVSSLEKTNAGLLYSVPKQQYDPKKYPRGTGLFNFHSVLPNADDPEYSLSLVGNNVLNNLESELSLTYDRNEGWKKFGLTETYGGLFPLISGSLQYTIDRRGLYRNKIVYWNEIEPQVGISIPLNLSKGRSLTRFNIGSRYIYNQTDFQGIYKDTFGRISYSYLSNNLYLSNQVQMARQQINPSFAQTLSLGFKNALTKIEGWQFVANGNLYLPGLMRTHSLQLNGGFLQKDTLRQIGYSSGFPFSRGYTSQNLSRMVKWGVNYHLPLFLPDAGIGDIVYFLRVRSNLFYDDTHIKHFLSGTRFIKAKFRSVGTEIYFDTKWWNAAEVSFGVRYSHLLDKDLFGTIKGNRWEIILPVNLFDQ